MYAYIKGIAEFVSDSEIILDNAGIGYKISVPLSSSSVINPGDEVKLNTYMAVREDGIDLYGFFTEDELKMFKLLITVSKIGPKTAIAMLSSGSVIRIAKAVSDEDSDTLSQIPGIGKKTAERIILELKGKMKDFDLSGTTVKSGSDELISALSGLGYSDREIRACLENMDLSKGNLESQIKEALKLLYGKAGR